MEILYIHGIYIDKLIYFLSYGIYLRTWIGLLNSANKLSSLEYECIWSASWKPIRTFMEETFMVAITGPYREEGLTIWPYLGEWTKV